MMDATSRETQISEAFVTLTDTLTTDFDVVDLLHTLVEECTKILDTDQGGLMLVDSSGELQLMTSTSEEADFVEVMQLNASSGPCIECFTTGKAVSVADISAGGSRWPEFQKAAIQGGFKSAHATPMRLRGQVIGTMNLFSTTLGQLNERDIALAQALTDVATIALLQERIVSDARVVPDQLHRALDTRILIEQAKGMISHTFAIPMDSAFDVIRTYARNNGLAIRTVAERISQRTIEVRSLIPQAAAHRQPE